MPRGILWRPGIRIADAIDVLVAQKAGKSTCGLQSSSSKPSTSSASARTTSFLNGWRPTNTGMCFVGSSGQEGLCTAPGWSRLRRFSIEVVLSGAKVIGFCRNTNSGHGSNQVSTPTLVACLRRVNQLLPASLRRDAGGQFSSSEGSGRGDRMGKSCVLCNPSRQRQTRMRSVAYWSRI